MRRRNRVIIAAIPVLLVAAHVTYWHVTSDRLRSGLETWMAEQRARGWQVDAGPPARGGWPRTASVSIPNLTFRHIGRDLPGELSWTSAEATASVSLYRPDQLVIELAGPQHVRVADAPDAIATADQFQLSVDPVEAGRLPIALHVQSLRLEPAAGGWHATVGLLNADASILPAARRSEPAVTVSVAAEAISLPGNVKWPLGPNISSLSFAGALNGPLPSERGSAGWAGAWRDGGGSLEISRFVMGWGPLGLTAAATVALDDRLQPAGSGNAGLIGYAETLDRLAGAGALSRSAAMAAKAVLSLMAGSADGGASPRVDVPLVLQYRTLSMGQVPLLRLPELDWGVR